MTATVAKQKGENQVNNIRNKSGNVEVVTNCRTQEFVGLIRRGLKVLGDADDVRVETVLTALEVRLKVINRGQSAGFDAEESFRLRMLVMDEAIQSLCGVMGGGVRAVFCWAMAKLGAMGPSPEERLRQAIGI